MTRVGRGTSRVARATLPAIIALITMVGACGRDDAAGGDSAGAARTAPTTGAATGAAGAAGTAGAPDALCPRTGHWTICLARDRIEAAGLVPLDTVIEKLPALGPAPTVYRVNKAGLALYLFQDSLARSRAARTLDTTRFVSPERPLTVLTEATVIQNDNLLALFFGKNEHQRERVSDALTAGPPQL